MDKSMKSILFLLILSTPLYMLTMNEEIKIKIILPRNTQTEITIKEVSNKSHIQKKEHESTRPLSSKEYLKLVATEKGRKTLRLMALAEALKK